MSVRQEWATNGLTAAVRVARPLLGQVEAAVDEGVSARGGIGEHDHGLAIADITGQPAVLEGHPDGLGALLLRLGIVDDQRRLRVAEVLDHVVAHRVAELVGAPDRTVEQPLHPVRRHMPGPFRQRPAVLLRQLRQQPLDILREHHPRLGPVEQPPQRTGQIGQFRVPSGYLLSRHTRHHARSTRMTGHGHKISDCSTRITGKISDRHIASRKQIPTREGGSRNPHGAGPRQGRVDQLERHHRRQLARIPGHEPARGRGDRTSDGHHRGRRDMVKRQRGSPRTSRPGRPPPPTSSVVLRRESLEWLA